MSKRIQVTFTKEQWSMIEKFRGILGESDAELIRNIVLIWLSEKSIITTKIKKDMDDENGHKNQS
ncbi:CopG family transcriptional regulator [Methanocaldococcus sp.]|uniref:CopG family transcriptional regulator n=1 Tax=Methanocaldococcus sp. TaxID=2152917 RepID=UPI00262BC7C8|nr:CopG family transcriptional regulator [Methanocaldococcus sp.]MCQ6254032.1 CopG family transcriptional regulator [Methanocaldococcus sp.]